MWRDSHHQAGGGHVIRLAVLALVACSTENVFEPPDYGFERMLSQPRYDPFEASPFFSDGRVMQPPPEGTVAHDSRPAPEISGDRPGTLTQRLPMPVTRELLATGRKRYDVFCAPCHGVLGDSNSVVGRNMPLVRPRPLVSGELASAPPGRIYRAIDAGYGLMPDYQAQLDIDERWAVTAYVLALRVSQKIALSALPPELRQEAQGALR
jgi:mono/diheme cytochrome c family protein